MAGTWVKKEVDQFYDLAQPLKTHPSKAQILLEVNSEADGLEEVLTVLRDICIQPVEHQILRKDGPTCIILYLSVGDMGQAVLRLTETGFTRLKGINPRNSIYKRKESDHGKQNESGVDGSTSRACPTWTI